MQAAVEEHQLVRALGWYDGFVIALANPGFLIGFLGYSIGALGGWAAVALWAVWMLIGTLSNRIYAELAAMFPDKLGGIALYAQRAGEATSRWSARSRRSATGLPGPPSCPSSVSSSGR